MKRLSRRSTAAQSLEIESLGMKTRTLIRYTSLILREEISSRKSIRGYLKDHECMSSRWRITFSDWT